MAARFDRAWVHALEAADRYAAAEDCDVIVVRDLLGRNAVAVGGANTNTDALGDELRAGCDPFVGVKPVLRLDEMVAPELLTQSRDRRPAPPRYNTSERVTVIERSAVGADWLAPTSAPSASTRVALYGYKGGVGRSTATFALAHHLASLGKVILVVDLDLESPGVSTMLAPDLDGLPRHGIVDHLVEYGVGNEAGLDLVARSDAVGRIDGNGEVWLAAAAGQPADSSDYLDKLSRAYIDLPALRGTGRGPIAFGERLEAAVAACEAEVERESRRPDVVLLDSRSGIHDIAAVAITQLSTLALLFATDDPQTWRGYGDLFRRWATRLPRQDRSDLRQRVQMVAAMVPPRDIDGYLAGFIDRAQACFAETLYDDVITASAEAFNFAPQDMEAPHYPLPIQLSADLIGVVPGVDPAWNTAGSVNFAYREFLEGATRLILEDTDALS